MRIKTFLILLVSFFIMGKTCFAQVSTNLEIISLLIDSSAAKISQTNDQLKKGFYLKNNLPQNYSILNNQIISAFINNGNEVFNKPVDSHPELGYSITSIKVNYSDLYKDGFLGGYKLTREIILYGNYSLSNTGSSFSAVNFKFTSSDSIDYDSINQIESSDLNFTRGTKPDEPMFSSLLEPAIAVCTAAVVIYLFFTVRSK